MQNKLRCNRLVFFHLRGSPRARVGSRAAFFPRQIRREGTRNQMCRTNPTPAFSPDRSKLIFRKCFRVAHAVLAPPDHRKWKCKERRQFRWPSGRAPYLGLCVSRPEMQNKLRCNRLVFFHLRGSPRARVGSNPTRGARGVRCAERTQSRVFLPTTICGSLCDVGSPGSIFSPVGLIRRRRHWQTQGRTRPRIFFC